MLIHRELKDLSIYKINLLCSMQTSKTYLELMIILILVQVQLMIY